MKPIRVKVRFTEADGIFKTKNVYYKGSVIQFLQGRKGVKAIIVYDIGQKIGTCNLNRIALIQEDFEIPADG